MSASARSSADDFCDLTPIGSGAQGVVYKAFRKADGRAYALKELRLGGLDERELGAVLREASVLGELSGDCPHVLRYYDAFLNAGKLYIVTGACVRVVRARDRAAAAAGTPLALNACRPQRGDVRVQLDELIAAIRSPIGGPGEHQETTLGTHEVGTCSLYADVID